MSYLLSKEKKKMKNNGISFETKAFMVFFEIF